MFRITSYSLNAFFVLQQHRESPSFQSRARFLFFHVDSISRFFFLLLPFVTMTRSSESMSDGRKAKDLVAFGDKGLS